MSSLIPNYEYDIFISYRQKDNKGDRWVSEFVEALRTELESTFKEEISVYFDINPHDGLLETHDVDASLKDKLKCLVFIPIISRTYCDPKSFAWEHEFKAFVELAIKDHFGLKVKLPNGNVASRVLPVRIHDLDTEDVKFFEGVTGGVMRTLDFVFKTSSGVNRPLKSREDHPNDNLNKTYYQDQINKVALAIKEIFQGMKTEPIPLEKEKTLHREPLEEVKKETRMEEQKKYVKATKRKILSGIIIVVVLSVLAILTYPKLFRPNTLEKLRSSGRRISVAVMPFQNMTNDTIWNIWQDGIQNELINNLTNSEELEVRQIESITGLMHSKGLTNYASITPEIASSISKKLDANVFIYGSIKQAGTIIRVNSQLIDSKTQEAIKSFQIDGVSENILHIIDSLSGLVKNFLIISKLEKEAPLGTLQFASSSFPEAYRYFNYGMKAFLKRDYPTARTMYFQALAIDSNFIEAKMYLAFAFDNQGLRKEGRDWCLKVYGGKDKMNIKQKIFMNFMHAAWFETPTEEIKYLKQSIEEVDAQSPYTHWQLGLGYAKLYQFDKAIPEYEKTLEIFHKWGSKPDWLYCYTALGYAYHKTGQYTKEKELYRKAEKDFPDDPDLIYRQAVLSLTEGDTIAANRFINKGITIAKENLFSEADITTSLAYLYVEAGIMDKAEEYYRQALSLEPKSAWRIANLAWFLIDQDRNLKEGVELVNKALEINPNEYQFMHSKGWGLYKQGKYEEALQCLNKSWELKPMYEHELYLHLEAAKKAVANQKNN